MFRQECFPLLGTASFLNRLCLLLEAAGEPPHSQSRSLPLPIVDQKVQHPCGPHLVKALHSVDANHLLEGRHLISGQHLIGGQHSVESRDRPGSCLVLDV